MWDVRVCVACLATDVRMHSISANSLLQPYQLLTGKEFQAEDKMPQKLCWECAALVNKFNLFRHKCERAYLLLQDIYNQHDELTEENFKQIDRNNLNLSSVYGFSETSNFYFLDNDPESPKKYKTNKKSKLAIDDTKAESDFESSIEIDDIKLELDTEDELPLLNLSQEFKCLKKSSGKFQRKSNNKIDSKSTLDVKSDKLYPNKEIEEIVSIKKESHQKVKVEDGNLSFQLNAVKEESSKSSDREHKSIDNKKNGLRKRKLPKNKSERKDKIEKKKKKKDKKKLIKELENGVKVEVKREPLNKKVDFADFATAVMLTQEQQMDEIRKRRDTASFKEAFFKCSLCYKGFVNDKAYANHMRKHDPATGEYQCDICKSRFKKRYYVADHIYKVHMTKYVCKFCPFVSQCVYQASTHYKWHKGVVYKCNICTEQFTTKSTFLSHRRIKHASEHVCPACGESFVSRLGLLQHNSRLHKNASASETSGPYCEECKVQFASHEAWTKHTVISPRHAADPQLRNGCRDCGATFACAKELRAHRTARHRRLKVRAARRGAHADGYPVKCAQCSEIMESARRYWQHFRRSHPTEQYPSSKPAICEYCGKGFKCKSVLAYHRNTHTGKRNYTCSVCPKTFFTPQNLDNHLKSHSDSRPYVCDLCSKGFKFSVALLRHRRIHTGEKPYVCDVCGKGFTDSSGRKVHVRTVHLKEPTPYVSKARLEKRRQVDTPKSMQEHN